MRGFPRMTGHCKSHKSSYISNGKLITPKHVLDKIIMTNNDLIRGDVIKFHDDISCSDLNTMIFDGCNIISLSHVAIPNEFTIINDNVPIAYWEILGNRMNWFNHISVKQQCIDNIKQENKYIDEICTEFTLNDKSYKIICRHGIGYPVLMKGFKEKLLSNDKLQVYNNGIDNQVQIRLF